MTQISAALQRAAGPPQPPATFESLFREHSSHVSAVALRLMRGQADDADDLVQDVFVLALEHIRRLRSAAAIRGWLTIIAVRLARRRLRVIRQRAYVDLEDEAEDDEMVAPDASPEDQALVARVCRVLDSLPENLRVVWALRHIEGEQLEQAAELCGCSLATYKRWLAEAHERVLKELSVG